MSDFPIPMLAFRVTDESPEWNTGHKDLYDGLNARKGSTMNLTIYIDGDEHAVIPLEDGNDSFNAAAERGALDRAYEAKESDPTAVVSIVVNTDPLPELGQRVRLTHNVERYPHFIAPKGATGVVTNSEPEHLTVKLDEHLPGADEWDNEVIWMIRDGDDPSFDLEVVTARTYMDFRFDVTGLNDEERGHLAGYVIAQAEGERSSESYYPSVSVEHEINEVDEVEA